MSLDCVLAAEGADVAGVLSDFHLLHLLSKRGAISGGRLVNDLDHCRVAFNDVLRVREEKALNWAAILPGTVFTSHADLCAAQVSSKSSR